MSTCDVNDLELSISGLSPDRFYRLTIVTSEDDVDVLRLESWDDHQKHWLPMKWEEGSDARKGH